MVPPLEGVWMSRLTAGCGVSDLSFPSRGGDKKILMGHA
jgi:hypothetical protein